LFSITILTNQGDLQNTVVTALSPGDYQVFAMQHGDAAIEELAQDPPYVLIFDHGDGGHLSELRALAAHEEIRTHTAILAILTPEHQQILEESPPPDDFLIWPARGMEILLRVRAILRRRANVDSENVLRCGGLLIDLANYKVMLDGRPIELTFKEYELLRFLASNRDKVFTRESLLNRVWGYDYFGGARTVDVHIRRLRSKIEDRGHAFIETIRNVGYRFHEG
jgi:DNA-binding response OmpR family regulator